MSGENVMTFGRNFTGEVCSCCRKQIPHGDYCVRVTVPDRPPRVICTACAYEAVGEMIKLLQGEQPAKPKATEKKRGKTK